MDCSSEFSKNPEPAVNTTASSRPSQAEMDPAYEQVTADAAVDEKRYYDALEAQFDDF